MGKLSQPLQRSKLACGQKAVRLLLRNLHLRDTVGPLVKLEKLNGISGMCCGVSKGILCALPQYPPTPLPSLASRSNLDFAARLPMPIGF